MQRPTQRAVGRMLQASSQPAMIQPALSGTTNGFPDTSYDTAAESSYMPQPESSTWMQQSTPPARVNDSSPAIGISKRPLAPRMLHSTPPMINSSPMQPYFPEDSLVTSYI